MIGILFGFPVRPRQLWLHDADEFRAFSWRIRSLDGSEDFFTASPSWSRLPPVPLRHICPTCAFAEKESRANNTSAFLMSHSLNKDFYIEIKFTLRFGEKGVPEMRSGRIRMPRCPYLLAVDALKQHFAPDCAPCPGCRTDGCQFRNASTAFPAYCQTR